uniref:Ribosomal protein L34 n=1 Tax=Rhodomela confervoides TaxID=35163 RepID=A0A1Z1M9M7_RHOCN|nr:ribosomal protein L34 [Rhodomela confervoides]ARW62592.1 ribosomal protein L34 [Rhodomela confervoides]
MKTGTRLKKVKKSGFRVRMKSKGGQKTIKNKRRKKRKLINVS